MNIKVIPLPAKMRETGGTVCHRTGDRYPGGERGPRCA